MDGGWMERWVDGWIDAQMGGSSNERSIPTSISKLFLHGFPWLPKSVLIITNHHLHTLPLHLGSLIPFIYLNNHFNLWDCRQAWLIHSSQVGCPHRFTNIWTPSPNFAKKTLPGLTKWGQNAIVSHRSKLNGLFGALNFLWLFHGTQV